VAISGEVQLRRRAEAGRAVPARLGRAAREAVVTILTRQADQARAAIGKPLGEVAPSADKTYRKRYNGTPLELVLAGDSIAAGLGALRPKTTLGARLAKELGDATHRPVRLTTIAEVGAETWMVAERQLPRLDPGHRPDLAVLIVGGNDVTHRIPVAESVAALERAVTDLRRRGAVVVVGTCPDLAAVRPVPQPLRTIGSLATRQLATAQARAARAAGAHVVKLADVVSPLFVESPDEMFAIDRFHPSEAGYRRTAAALLPSLLAALGEIDEAPRGYQAPAPR
jgi:lysophospholipase L1-like esterase